MKSLKLIVKIGLGLIVCGIIFSVFGFFMGGKFENISNDLVSLSSKNNKNISQTKQLGNFDKVDIDVDLDYIEIIKSDENKLELNYNEKISKVEYEIKENNLVITQPKNNNMGVHFNIYGFNNQNLNYLKLYVNDTTNLKNLKINAQDLDVKINSINSENTNIQSFSGNISIANLNSNNMDIAMNNGDLKLNNSTVSTNFTFKNNHGDINISNSNFNNFISNLGDGDFKVLNSNSKKAEIKNDHGSINSTGFLSNELNVDSADGDINIDGSLLGITTLNNKHGDIHINSNESESLYNYNIISKFGDVNIGNNSVGNSVVKETNSKNTLNITSNDGDVNVKFAK
jgi:hypothetical protein